MIAAGSHGPADGRDAASPAAAELTVGVVQTCTGTDVAANLGQVVAGVEAAARDGARLVVLPEYALAYAADGVDPRLAEPLDGPFARAVSQAAVRHDVAVALGTLVPAPDGRRSSNVAVLIGRDGTVRTQYAKTHLYDSFGFQESASLQAGPVIEADDAAVVTLDGLRVGLQICYDLRFPEVSRVLVDAGAQVLLVLAAWTAGDHKSDHLRVLARARAIENTAYVVVASQYGPGRVGGSVVVDPWGEVLAESPGDGADVLHARLRAEITQQARSANPSLDHRRYRVLPR